MRKFAQPCDRHEYIENGCPDCGWLAEDDQMKIFKQVHLDDGEIEYGRDEKGDVRFRVKGDNGEIVVTSEGYASEGNARRGLSTLKRILGKAPII